MTKVDQTILSETAGMFSLNIMELSKTNIGIYRLIMKNVSCILISLRQSIHICDLLTRGTDTNYQQFYPVDKQ